MIEIVRIPNPNFSATPRQSEERLQYYYAIRRTYFGMYACYLMCTSGARNKWARDYHTIFSSCCYEQLSWAQYSFNEATSINKKKALLSAEVVTKLEQEFK